MAVGVTPAPARPATLRQLRNVVDAPGEVLLCGACKGRWDAEEYCPVCVMLWKVPCNKGYVEDVLQCESCNLWVHAICELLTPDIDISSGQCKYMCPACRGCKPGEGEIIRAILTASEHDEDDDEAGVVGDAMAVGGADAPPLTPAKRPPMAAAHPDTPSKSAGSKKPARALMTAGDQGSTSTDEPMPSVDPNHREHLSNGGSSTGGGPSSEAAGGGIRRSRCGQCAGCSAANCGTCAACRNMPAYGGSGKAKQSCLRRRCTDMKIGSPPKARRAPAPVAAPPAVKWMLAVDSLHEDTDHTHAFGPWELSVDGKLSLKVGRKDEDGTVDAVISSDSQMSRVHAVLTLEQTSQTLTVTDCKSKYGTYIGDERLDQSPRLLDNGTKLRLGTTEFVVRRVVEKRAPTSFQSLHAAGPSHVPQAKGVGASLVLQRMAPPNVQPLPLTSQVPLVAAPTFQPAVPFQPFMLPVVAAVPMPSVPMAVGFAMPLPTGLPVATAPSSSMPGPPAGDATDSSVGGNATHALGAPDPGAHTSGEATARTTAERAATAHAAATALRRQYDESAAAFSPISASNFDEKMESFSTALEGVYGDLPFTRLDWATSILGTLVGLVCAQTCKNSWSSIGYANLAATFPTPTGEPDWDLVRQRRVDDIVPCIWHGPYFHRKAGRIHALLQRAHDDSGGKSTSLEHLYTWPSSRVREYLMGFNGISGKSIACLLLYRMGRVDFAVDANVLRVMTRLGWLKSLGISATEGISATDRRAAIRMGAVIPIIPPSLYRLAAHPQMRTATGGASSARKRPLLHSTAKPPSVRVRLALAVAEDGSVGVAMCVRGPKRTRTGATTGLTLNVSKQGHVRVGLQIFTTYAAAAPAVPAISSGGSSGLGEGVGYGAGIRRSRCGQCLACRTANCGTCAACRNMPAYGGSGKAKQSCFHRRCVNMKIGLPPPALPPQLLPPQLPLQLLAQATAPDLSIIPPATDPQGLSPAEASGAPPTCALPAEQSLVEPDMPMAMAAEPADHSGMPMAMTTEPADHSDMPMAMATELADHTAVCSTSDASTCEPCAATGQPITNAIDAHQRITNAIDAATVTDHPIVVDTTAQGAFDPTVAPCAADIDTEAVVLSEDGCINITPPVQPLNAPGQGSDVSAARGLLAPVAGACDAPLAPASVPAVTSVSLNSDAYKSAEARTPLKVVGALRMFCPKHNTYHVCKYTRKRVAAATSMGDAPVASGSGASAGGAAGGGHPYGMEADAGDIEELPKSLKRHAKRTQEHMNALLPSDTPPNSALATMLYRTHVYMITHGAVLCGETPQCGDCPLRKVCEYGSLLRSDGPEKAHYNAPQAAAPVTATEPVLAAPVPVAPASVSGACQSDTLASTPPSAAVPSTDAPAIVTAGATAHSSVDAEQGAFEADLAATDEGAAATDEGAASTTGEVPPADSQTSKPAAGSHDLDMPMASTQDAAPIADSGDAADVGETEEAADALGAATASRIISRALEATPSDAPAPPPLSAAALLAAASAVADNVAADDDGERRGSRVAGSSYQQHHDHVCQMAYARVVSDQAVAPSHPGDQTPRLLLVQSTIGDYAKGRLLMSPWSAFRGVFPMQGTYFTQNEVFEDEVRQPGLCACVRVRALATASMLLPPRPCSCHRVHALAFDILARMLPFAGRG